MDAVRLPLLRMLLGSSHPQPQAPKAIHERCGAGLLPHVADQAAKVRAQQLVATQQPLVYQQSAGANLKAHVLVDQRVALVLRVLNEELLAEREDLDHLLSPSSSSASSASSSSSSSSSSLAQSVKTSMLLYQIWHDDDLLDAVTKACKCHP
jgi:hypothetical protein